MRDPAQTVGKCASAKMLTVSRVWRYKVRTEDGNRIVVTLESWKSLSQGAALAMN